MDEENKLQLESKKKHLENINREIELISKQRPDIESSKDLLLEEIDNRKQVQQIILDNYVKLVPNWKFDEMPEFMELQKKFEIINFKKNDFKYQQSLTQIESNLIAVDKQLESLKPEKERITKEIEELEKEN